MMKTILTSVVAVALIFGFGNASNNAFAQSSQSVLYVPLIGITSVPEPLALPNGAGNVTYNYAVKNFLKEVALTGVSVVDDTCSPITFVEGDDNGDSKLDYNETWRYKCTTRLSVSAQSTATAVGTANNTTASHTAHATVIVGSSTPPPLVSIVNVSKIAYPLSLPAGGGAITFTYKVNNPGVVPLSDVTVTDDACSTISGRVGDTNGNNLLDTDEVWIYTCAATITQTATNTVHVRASANGLTAVGEATMTVNVENSGGGSSQNLFDIGISPGAGVNPDLKTTVWGILGGILLVLVVIFFANKRGKFGKAK